MNFDPSTAQLEGGFDPTSAVLDDRPVMNPAQQASRMAFNRSRQRRLDREEYSPANVPFRENVEAGMGQFLKAGELGNIQLRMPGLLPPELIRGQRETEAPLMATGAGKLGSIGMGIAATAPMMGVPGVNTVLGAASVGGGLGMMQPAENVTERALNTSLGAAGGAAGQKLGQVIGNRTGSAIARRKSAVLTPEQQAVKDAVDEGFKLTPQQMQSGGLSKTAAGISGRPQLEREFSRSNAKLVNSLAQQEIGLPPSKTLNRAGIAAKKTQANSVYDEVSKLPDGQFDQHYQYRIATVADDSGGQTFAASNPEVEALKTYYANIKNFKSKDVVQKVRDLRADGYKNMGAIRNPSENAVGRAQLKIADIMDEAMERHATNLGKPDLVNEYKAARVQLAKIHTLEDAIDGSHISAKEIFRQVGDQKHIGGNFRKISNAYESFDRSFQDVTKIRDHPLGFFDYMAGAAGMGGMAAGAAGVPVAGTVGLPVLAAVASRPLIRGALGTNALQNMMATPAGQGTNALRALQGGAGLLGPAGVVLPSYLSQQ